MQILIVSGTPGTGKTTISNNVKKYIDVKIIFIQLYLFKNLLLHFRGLNNQFESTLISEEKTGKVIRIIKEKKIFINFQYLKE